LICFVFTSCATADEEGFQVVFEAGDYNRQFVPVTFQAPDSLKHPFYELVDPEYGAIPVQIKGHQISAIIPELHAGERRAMRVVPSENRNEIGISTQQKEGSIAFISGNGQPVLHYRTSGEGQDLGGLDERFRRGGYLHPVYTPAGQIVTGHYHPDRPHQLGIWSGWSRVQTEARNPEFWYPVTGRGEIEVVSADSLWHGPVHSGLHAEHHFIDKTAEDPVPIISEKWTVQVYNTGRGVDRPLFIFDLESTQHNITDAPIIFTEHVYGGISFRGNDEWLGEEGTRLLTSEGKSRFDGAPVREVWSHVDSHQSRAKWAYLSGAADDGVPGIVILAHPENLNFPEVIFMNLREPFFAFTPSAMGDITIDPDESLCFRYRYVVMDNEPDPEFLEQMWQDFANPVTVAFK